MEAPNIEQQSTSTGGPAKGSTEWKNEYEQLRKKLEDTFSHSDYSIQPKELFAHRYDAAIVIRPDNISFNQSCINGMPQVTHIRLSVNEKLKRILVEPCDQDAPHALRWCVARADKRKCRKMACRDFAVFIYSLMNWDEKIRYKILAYKIKIKGANFGYIFMLDRSQRFENMTGKKGKTDAKDHVSETAMKQISAPGRSASKGYYSKETLESIGISYEQYKRDTEEVEKNGYIQLGMLTGDMKLEEINGIEG